MVDHFTGDVCALIRQYPGRELKQYEAILEENGLHWDKESMSGAVVEGLDARRICALLVAVVYAERFCDVHCWRFYEMAVLAAGSVGYR